MKHLYKAIIFDLDGTLLNTLGDIATCMNKVLSEKGFPTHKKDKYRIFVGDGLKELVERALPEKAIKPSLIKECMDDFESHYAIKWDELTKPYDGISRLIQYLKGKNIPMGILSNKPHRFTIEMSKHYFGDDCFKIIQGVKEGITPKPDSSSCLRMARFFDLAPENILFLGDSDTDMMAARSAGIFPIGAGWGFRGEQELKKAGAAIVINNPDELMEYV